MDLAAATPRRPLAFALTLALLAGACGSVAAHGTDAAITSDSAPGPDTTATTDAPPGLDAPTGTDAGPGGPCTSDSECSAGAQWCVAGTCVPCDNSGEVCDILCANGWTTYERNGCYPCECAPTNQCASDTDCAAGSACYAGAFCWDWCPAGDPSCCFGNICSLQGCTPPPPMGCVTRGCPAGQTCDTAAGCVSSSCSCSGSALGWACTDDCGGGACI